MIIKVELLIRTSSDDAKAVAQEVPDAWINSEDRNMWAHLAVRHNRGL